VLADPSGSTRSSDDFVEHVLQVVESIPPGHVMTYGDIAATVGSNAPRAVGKVMAHGGSDVPWWRVIRASGHPPLCHGGQALEYYRAEGTPLLWAASGNYRIDLRLARHRP
jgi:alkylated DNA nucleotide flippase Atl1